MKKNVSSILIAKSSLSDIFTKSFSKYRSARLASASANLLISVFKPLNFSKTTARRKEKTSLGKEASFEAELSIMSDL